MVVCPGCVTEFKICWVVSLSCVRSNGPTFFFNYSLWPCPFCFCPSRLFSQSNFFLNVVKFPCVPAYYNGLIFIIVVHAITANGLQIPEGGDFGVLHCQLCTNFDTCIPSGRLGRCCCGKFF